MIQLIGVSKIYPGSSEPAVNSIDLDIESGEFVFLVGPSGAGKTTLTKLVFGEVSPTAGNVYFQGKNIARYRPAHLLKHRRSIGVVFQDFRLIKSKTVYENVAFALEVVGKSSGEIKLKVPAVLEKVGLSHKHDAFPNQLSGGEQQRVGIARAIIKDPLVILADEPTGNVDPNTAREIMKLFEMINEEGTTVVVATHAWELVGEMNKRVVSIEEGYINSDSKHSASRGMVGSGQESYS